MRRARYIIFLLVLVTGVGCQQPTQSLDTPKGKPRDASTVSVQEVVYGLLKENKRSGSLIVRVDCGAPGIVDRRVSASLITKTLDWKEALTRLTVNDNSLSWHESEGLARVEVKSKENGRMVRVVDNSLKPKLLEVRIKELNVPEARDPDDVLLATKNSPEVQKFMEQEKSEFIHSISTIHAGTVSVGPDGSIRTTYPPGTKPAKRYYFKNARVEEILDQIVSTSSGIWIYEECESKNAKEIGLSVVLY